MRKGKAMRGQRNKLYVWGVFLTIIGGAGLAGIEMDSHIFFWIYAITFSAGIGLCLAGYEHGN